MPTGESAADARLPRVGIVVGDTRSRSCRSDTRRAVAEFGVVFLMFSIGLEFSLPKLRAMRRVVFGLGLVQVAITTLGAMSSLHFLGYGWQAGWCSAARLRCRRRRSSARCSPSGWSSTAARPQHHRRAAVPGSRGRPFLIVIPALGKAGGGLATRSARGGQGRGRARGAAVPRPALMRALVPPGGAAALAELFVLNVLLVTLGSASITE